MIDDFLLYTADVTNIALRCGLNVHSYADDTQLYVHCDAVNCAAEAARLVACVEELDGWMASNRLKLNAAKTQVMWVGTRQQLKKIVGAEITLQGHRIVPSTSVVCLSVHTDPELTFALHVKRVRRDVSTISANCGRFDVHCPTTTREC